MKNILFLALLIFAASSVNAQSKDRQVISSGGTFVNTPTAIVSYTVGEIAIQYLTAAGASLSQGFQQANNWGTSIKTANSIEATISTYPNPFVNFIEIKSDKMLVNPSFQLVDATGKTIQTQPIEMTIGKHWRINVAQIASGNYWLSIIAEDKQGTYSLTHFSQ